MEGIKHEKFEHKNSSKAFLGCYPKKKLSFSFKLPDIFLNFMLICYFLFDTFASDVTFDIRQILKPN